MFQVVNASSALFDRRSGAAEVPDELFREDTCSYITRLMYDFEKRALHVFMPEHSCTDMDGVIALAKAIDPQVLFVATYAGTTGDTSYVYEAGEWKAVSWRRI